MLNKRLIGTFGPLLAAGAFGLSAIGDQHEISSLQRNVVRTNDFGVVGHYDIITVTNTVESHTYTLEGVEKLGDTNRANLNYHWKPLASEVASSNTLTFSIRSPTNQSQFYRVGEAQ